MYSMQHLDCHNHFYSCPLRRIGHFFSSLAGYALSLLDSFAKAREVARIIAEDPYNQDAAKKVMLED
ncbi:MAG: hypothetical protein C0622_10500 [Desulfuromonas sp.]|nr:MAG: hypothetical protein C0622_10500 [Desulfuromonas sp.]